MSHYSLFTKTPMWVWFLFPYLIFIGKRSMKERVVSMPMMFVMPTIFFVLFIKRLIEVVDFKTMALAISSQIIGLVIGCILAKKVPIKVDDNNIITVPGTIQTFVLVMTIFYIKYIFGVIKVQNQLLSLKLINLEIFVSGLSSGCFLGKALYYLYTVKKIREEKNKKNYK